VIWTLNFKDSRRGKRESLLLGSPELGDKCFLLLFGHGPIVIDLNGNFVRDFDRWVVLIELVEVLLLFEDGLLWGLLALSIFIFFFRGVFLFSLLFLSCFIDFESLEVGSMVGLELFFRIFNHFSTVFSSLFRLSNQTFTVLTCLLTHGLTSSDVLFTGVYGELKPLVDLSESWVIGVNRFLITSFNDSLAVVDSLIHFVFACFLSEDFILLHSIGDLIVNVFVSNFPPEVLGLGLANLFFGEAE